jgi:hypothetical protein
VSGSKTVPTPVLLLPVLGVSSKVSNLILSPGSCYVVELSGKFTPVETSGMAPLTPEDTRRIAYELIDGKKLPFAPARKNALKPKRIGKTPRIAIRPVRPCQRVPCYG